MLPGEQVLLSLCQGPSLLPGPQAVGSALGAKAWLGLCSALCRSEASRSQAVFMYVCLHSISKLCSFGGTESVSFFCFSGSCMNRQWELWENFWIHDKTTVFGCVEIETHRVKCVHTFLAFSSFVRLSLEAWVCSYPKMKASTALVLYHTHCAFNQLAEMESGKDKWEKDWQAACTLPQKPWQFVWELWPWPALKLVGLWLTHYLLFVVKFLLEQIFLGSFSRAAISPHRTSVQMMKRITSPRQFTAICCTVVINTPIHSSDTKCLLAPLHLCCAQLLHLNPAALLQTQCPPSTEGHYQIREGFLFECCCVPYTVRDRAKIKLKNACQRKWIEEGCC